MRSYPSTELKQNLGDVLVAAGREPVTITKHGKSRFVLMSIEAYETRFTGDPRRSYQTREMPEEHLEMLDQALREIEQADRG